MEKQTLHPRNPHRFRYDFEALTQTCPALVPYISLNQYQIETINFSDANAVKMLNKAILQHFYGIQHWDIPNNYLCPPIPGRADYIHYLADLLASDNKGEIPMGNHIRGLDVGVGANCIYPILGHRSYGWRFVGTDIDAKAIQVARTIVNVNPQLRSSIECRLQTQQHNIFKGIVNANEKFDFTMCNPPFHASLAEARAGTQRKWNNLGHRPKDTLNFGGQHAELWCEGGELMFISKMIEESKAISKQCLWFSSLVSKKTTLSYLYKQLTKASVFDVRTIEMEQGQKVSRLIAWTFLDDTLRERWRNNKYEL